MTVSEVDFLCVTGVHYTDHHLKLQAQTDELPSEGETR